MNSQISIQDLEINLNNEYKKIITEYWNFLNYGWPTIKKTRNHTRIISNIKNYNEIKKEVFNKLGVIPVYFFMVILFGDQDYPGSYNTIEKGLLILYFILKNIPFESMDKYISKSTFHDIYRTFYETNRINRINKTLNYCMSNMFSNINTRILNGIIQNPDLFKQVTIHLDGHDTRGIVYGAKDKSIYYN